MAMTLYSGFVGSGKSYHATREGIRFADASFGYSLFHLRFHVQLKLYLTWLEYPA